MVVGYGDFYPQTFLGRLIVFFICIWGTIAMSLMVVVLTGVLNMSRSESKVIISYLCRWI